jgi:hypothetical protein
MARRKEALASIGCAGLCFVFVVALWTGSRLADDSGGTHPRVNPPAATAPAPSPPALQPEPEPREWVYIHGPMNVRAAPDKDARTVRTLSRGDLVELGRQEANGWARIYTGAAEEEYVYRASDLVRPYPPAALLPPEVPDVRPPRQLRRGPRGGCYYINSSGNKQYVDRSECN